MRMTKASSGFGVQNERHVKQEVQAGGRAFGSKAVGRIRLGNSSHDSQIEPPDVWNLWCKCGENKRDK